MGSHMTPVNHEVMQLVNLYSFNPCCGEVVLTSIEVGEGGLSHVSKLLYRNLKKAISYYNLTIICG